MEKVKVYQIVIPDNPVSMEYHELSKKSFERVNDIIEIIPFDAITPYHEDFEEHESRYNWKQSLMKYDLVKGHIRHKDEKPHSPTERAGMCSHWELMRLRKETQERFWVTEHDTYLIPEHENVFRYLIDIVKNRNIDYANIGLFMGMYSFNRHMAHFGYDMLTRAKPETFPINCGPYGVLERLFKTYLTMHRRKHPDWKHFESTFIHPWGDCTTLCFGKTEEEMRAAYNTYCTDTYPEYPRDFWLPVPTTQMIKKDLKVTQDHREYEQRYIDEPWTRHKQFKVID